MFEKTVLLLQTVQSYEPSSVERTLTHSLVPGQTHLREQILVAILTLEILPMRHGGYNQNEGAQYINYFVHVRTVEVKVISSEERKAIQWINTGRQTLSISHVIQFLRLNCGMAQYDVCEDKKDVTYNTK